MQRFLDKVTEWLFEASENIGQDYFQLPVTGEEPRYRERVYCYELYHLWRCNWTDGFPFSLSGEVDKQKHPIIRRKVKPDFLVHIPGQMTNLLVMEVKPKPKPGIDVPYHTKDVTEILDDLEKLTWVRRELTEYGANTNYFAAFMWFYGLNVEEWPTLRECLRARIGNQNIDPMLIRYLLHQQFGEKAVEVHWHV